MGRFRLTHKPVANLPRKYREGSPIMWDKDYSPDELEFMLAMQARKAELSVPSLPWPEVLRVAKALGYRKEGAA